MSKGEGKKIGIKFTNDLVGDVIGNESAFKVTGKEYKYTDGPLLDKEYLIDKVERYPVQRLWKIQNEITLPAGDSPSGYGGDLTSLGIPIAYNEFGAGYEKEKAFDKNNSTLWYATGTVDRWIGIDYGGNPQTTTKFTVVINPSRFKGYVFEGSNDNINWTPLATGDFANITTLQEITFLNSQAYRYYRLRCTSVYTGSNVGVSELEMFSSLFSYDTTHTENFPLIQLNGDYRVRWQEDKPIDTNIVIEYTTGETQGQWIEVANGEVVTVDTNLWIRAILSTSDTSLTPTLYDLWLEDSSAPQDKILITMDDIQGRFPTVEGNLTVEYDATKGNLTGQGGAVDSFITIFAPIDLAPEPNPGIVETITGAPSISIDYLEVTYYKGYAAETITAAPAEITVAFLSTEVINP